jgi:hypothetical protein
MLDDSVEANTFRKVLIYEPHANTRRGQSVKLGFAAAVPIFSLYTYKKLS